MNDLIVYHDPARRGWVVRPSNSQRLFALVPDCETALEIACLRAEHRHPNSVRLITEESGTTLVGAPLLSRN